MQLDKIIIALRQRTPWEAMDLGVMVIRKLWPVLLFPWLALMGITLIFTLFIEYQGYGYFGMFFLWWIKPVYDSLILHVLSRGIFADYVTATDVFNSLGDWLKTGVLTTVLFWRLSPSRSFNMPVHQLEGLTGAARKNRLNALHRVTGSHAMGATVLGVHFEYLLTITLYVLVLYIAPDTSIELFETLTENPEDELIWLIGGSVIYAIVIFILEPVYVAAGFMLYLNRRTQLEGWDIELDFRRLAERIKDPHHHTMRGKNNV